ncbi:MAG: hypothetical protein ACYC0E_14790, partial [Acidimicrobiales bacterium]
MSALETTTLSPVTGGDVAAQRRTDVPRVTGFSLVLLGLVTLLLGAWGGIAPFVGPTFGYRPAGRSSWHWNEAHGLLAVAPGAVAVLVGLLLMGVAPGVVAGRGRLRLLVLGAVLLACGGWFVVGPTAWPVVHGGAYFHGGSPLHVLVDRIGASFGPGVLLAICGGIALGWSIRHRAYAAVPAAGAPGTAAPVAGTADRSHLRSVPAAEPVAAEPVAAQPVAAEPVATAPGVTESAVATGAAPAEPGVAPTGTGVGRS